MSQRPSPQKRAKPKLATPATRVHRRQRNSASRLVILTGLSGSGKVSALKVFEDLGYYCVDNLPAELIPSFAELVIESTEPLHAAMVVDIREGSRLDQIPAVIGDLKRRLDTRLLFLECEDNVLLRRFSETRRPHPLGNSSSVKRSINHERQRLEPIKNLSDIILDTSKFNVHELRDHITNQFRDNTTQPKTILISTVSFGFKKGVPEDADLVFDVRFLPNPHFVPEFRPLTGRHPKVAKFIRGFPQTQEFITRISDLLVYLLPHYIEEGKSYLTIAFGCTGGQHRSVMIAEEVKKRLTKAGYRVKSEHRDSPR
ncbi:MAG: RNase adapter RapZ [Candidatus Korobacteraceae bacterium]